jgi:ankyrin repeat protein
LNVSKHSHYLYLTVTYIYPNAVYANIPALHEAVKSNQASMVKLLIQKGANPNEKKMSKVALDIAIENRNREMIDLLRMLGAQMAKVIILSISSNL